MIWAIRIKRKVLPQNLANIINFSSLTPPVQNVICHLKELFQTVCFFTVSYIQLKVKISSQENIKCVNKRVRIWKFWVIFSFLYMIISNSHRSQIIFLLLMLFVVWYDIVKSNEWRQRIICVVRNTKAINLQIKHFFTK